MRTSKERVFKSVPEVPWNPEIPNNWELVRLKSLLSRKKLTVGANSKNLQLLSLTLRGVIVRDVSKSKGKFPASFDTYQQVNKGDFVFCLFDIAETPRTVGLSRHDGMITGAYTVYKGHDGFDPKFLHWFLIYCDDDKRFETLYRGLRKTIPKQVFESIQIPLPDLDEQKLITRFLDNLELQVLESVSAKKKLISLLNELRDSKISETLLSYSTTSAKDWFGELPSGWTSKPARALFEERIERSQPEAEMLSVTIGRGVIKQSDYLVNAIRNRDQSNLDKSKYKVVKKDDIVYNKMRAWQGAAGKSEFDGIASPAYVVLKCKEGIDPDYYGLLFRTKLFAKEAEKFSYGISSDQWSLRSSDLKRIEFPIPPLDFQRAAVKKLSMDLAEVELSIESIELEIKLIEEYRRSTVGLVVTGKIDICDIALDMRDIDADYLSEVKSGLSNDIGTELTEDVE
jgi:type I restriction enzyme S subunit